MPDNDRRAVHRRGQLGQVRDVVEEPDLRDSLGVGPDVGVAGSAVMAERGCVHCEAATLELVGEVSPVAAVAPCAVDEKDVVVAHSRCLACRKNWREKLHAPVAPFLTFRDRALTIGDMASVVRAAALQGYMDAMRDLGTPPRALLRRHGIDPAVLDDANALISLEATARLLEQSAAATGCPDFGLRLAGHQGIAVLGPLAVAMQNALTVEQAIADASRYLFFHSPAYEVAHDDHSPIFTDAAVLRFEVRLDEFLPRRQLLDGCLGTAWQIVRAITRGRNPLKGVSLPHTPIAPEANYRRFFGCPVFFAQPYAGLHADRDLLGAELQPASPMLRQMALEYLAQHLPPRTQGLSGSVRQALTRTIGISRGTKSEIAALLYMHPRTLQRHLAHEGQTFDAIREQVYREAMLRFLRETDIPLAQLAGVLGYSDQSALTRSCRRWFGTTPSRIRRKAA
jgi:AraC-like DNA-binding protein